MIARFFAWFGELGGGRVLERIESIDPEQVTVDTVRTLWPLTPRWCARLILNTGVRRGTFTRNSDGSLRLSTLESR